MAAPAGNRFWEFRSKHGRDKLFSEPELLWKESVKYFNWCEDHPLMETDFRGKDATEVFIPKVRAFTISGLCLYLDVNRKFFSDFQDACTGRSDEKSKDFSLIISKILETIYTQKFTAAAAGFLKENLIARETGLAEKSQVHQITQNASDYIDYSEVSDEALKEIKIARENKRLEGGS